MLCPCGLPVPPATLYDTSQLHAVSLPPQLLRAPDDLTVSSLVPLVRRSGGMSEIGSSQPQAVSLPPQLLG